MLSQIRHDCDLIFISGTTLFSLPSYFPVNAAIFLHCFDPEFLGSFLFVCFGARVWTETLRDRRVL